MGICFIFSYGVVFCGMLCSALVRGCCAMPSRNHFTCLNCLRLLETVCSRRSQKACPAKLEVKNKGNLMSVITSDIEFECFLRTHCIAVVFLHCYGVLIAQHQLDFWVLLHLLSYLVVGVAIPLAMSKRPSKILLRQEILLVTFLRLPLITCVVLTTCVTRALKCLRAPSKLADQLRQTAGSSRSTMQSPQRNSRNIRHVL